MVSIVLASHGDLAAGIKQTGSMVFGDQPSVAVVSLEPSMGPDDFRAKVEEAIASFEDQEQVLFLVDLWGGTPFNQISGLIEGHDSWAIVTGVNLPMLIEAYSQRFDAKNTAHAIAKHLVTEAKGKADTERQKIGTGMHAHERNKVEGCHLHEAAREDADDAKEIHGCGKARR